MNKKQIQAQTHELNFDSNKINDILLQKRQMDHRKKHMMKQSSQKLLEESIDKYKQGRNQSFLPSVNTGEQLLTNEGKHLFF